MLAALILVAAVANLNLAVANVALPDIGQAFDASQTELNLVAVSYSLGLAASVLYLGALGDRYGRKLMLILGVVLSVPACLLAAWAPSVEVLIVARAAGRPLGRHGLPDHAGADHRPVVRSGAHEVDRPLVGPRGAISSLGPLTAGALLEEFWWGSVFLITLPLAVVALVMAVVLVPEPRQRDHRSGRQPRRDPVDRARRQPRAGHQLRPGARRGHAGRRALPPSPWPPGSPSSSGSVAPRCRCTTSHIAGRRTFWVAACAGLIVFGTLMGAMFIGQQYLQNVLGYSTVEAGAAILPAALMMVLIAPRSAKLVETRGARFTLLVGYACCLLGFLTMLVLWNEGQSPTGPSGSGTPSSAPASGSPAHRPRTRSPARFR